MNSFTVGESKYLYDNKELKRGSLPVTFVRTIPLTPPTTERKTHVSAISDTSRSITYVQSPKPMSENSQTTYDRMRRQTNVKNILISLSTNFTQIKKKKVILKRDPYIIVQSIIRRHLVLHKYKEAELNRLINRSLVIEEIFNLKKRKTVANYECTLDKKTHKLILKEIVFLVNQIKDYNTKNDMCVRMLFLLYSCLSNSDDKMNMFNYATLLFDVFQFPVSKKLYLEKSGVVVPYSYSPHWCSRDFVSWFLRYKEYPSFPKSTIKSLPKSFINSKIGIDFIKKYCMCRRNLYDLKISLEKYDGVNKCTFVCRYCQKDYVFPLACAKHASKCQNSQKSL